METQKRKGDTMRLVILESPYSGEVKRNIKYAKECMRDCFKRNEAPFASHLLYTLILDDLKTGERKLGTEAGLAWGKKAEATVVYTDLGISSGMKYGIENAEKEGRKIEYRKIL